MIIYTVINMRKTYLEAIREAMQEEMRKDKSVFLLGEDIATYGGAFGVTRGMLEEFGEERIRNTPMSEMGIVGAATGAAMIGMRPIAEIMFMDFMGLITDQLINNSANFFHMSNGQFSVPMVVRTPAGAGRGYGATHSKSLEALLMCIPGLKIVAPSTAYDAKGLLKASIRDNNPVVFVEHKLLYGISGEVSEEDYTVPLGKAKIVKQGSDLTIIAHLRMNKLAIEAAEELEKQGIDVEVVDPRTLAPLDNKTILESVKKTGKVIIVEEGFKTAGVGAEISARIAEMAMDYLDAPILRIAGEDLPIPCCPTLENLCIPNKDIIIEKAKKLVE